MVYPFLLASFSDGWQQQVASKRHHKASSARGVSVGSFEVVDTGGRPSAQMMRQRSPLSYNQLTRLQ